MEVKPFDFEDLMLEKDGAYSGLQAYKNSKAANVMFTRKLARELNDTNIIVNCFCPGFIPGTELCRHVGSGMRFFMRYFLDFFMKPFNNITRSPKEGGASIVFLATDEKTKGKTGGYYSYDKLEEPSDEVKDENLQNKLWEMSVSLTKME